LTIFGCNLGYDFTVGKKPVELVINVQTPYMPITSTGKEPDLEKFLFSIRAVVQKAAAKCQKANREVPSASIVPRKRKGPSNDEQRRKYEGQVEEWAERLKKINAGLDFKPGARGFCYLLEQHGLAKGEFDAAEKLITECRKNGLLPLDFTAEDKARAADNLESRDIDDPMRYAEGLAQKLLNWNSYCPISFWDFQKVYIEAVVEKIDLKSLFSSICKPLHVPIMNAKGWSDINLRAGLMRRFREHERKGRRPILLYCGDHDPPGLKMSNTFLDNLRDLEGAVGWPPDNLIMDRFGLNYDFIEEHNLPWIDGLQTGSGKDLGDPNHKQHDASVQNYIAKYGKRKVESNALVVQPEAGRQLCRDAIMKYLDPKRIARYKEVLAQKREEVKKYLPDAVEVVLAELKKLAQRRENTDS
jgi:hypothetical protein